MSSDITIPAQEFDPESRRRALYVLAVSLFPLVLAALITTTVFSTGAIDTRNAVGSNTKYASIIAPKQGMSVPEKFQANGMIKQVPDGNVVFIAEFADGRYWPKRKLGSAPGPWSRDQVASGKSGYKYTLVLLAVPPKGEEQIDNWFANGRNTGKYPGIPKIEGRTTLAASRIVKK